MKKIILVILLIAPRSLMSVNHMRRRAAYFCAPTAIAYGYNTLTRVLHPYAPKTHVERLLWYNNPVLLVGFQALTYYCWSQTFSSSDDSSYDPNVHITVTTLR
jgi:hypothetical protein